MMNGWIHTQVHVIWLLQVQPEYFWVGFTCKNAGVLKGYSLQFPLLLDNTNHGIVAPRLCLDIYTVTQFYKKLLMHDYDWVCALGHDTTLTYLLWCLMHSASFVC